MQQTSKGRVGVNFLPQMLQRLLANNRAVISAYLSMISGSAGRLVLSLLYFISIANTLSIADFGLFATASAAGIMISRVLAFGFVSPLYRVATVKPHLVGTYVAGFLAGAAVSLPLIAGLALIVFYSVFDRDMRLPVFLAFMVAEIVCWRSMEVVVIVLNGLGRFGRGALLVIVSTGIRTVAAVLFSLSPLSSLADWSVIYLAANAIGLCFSLIWFFPAMRLRWRPRLYLRRWTDSVSVAGAEVLFYVQSEFDKIVVLAIGGPAVSGVYAIIMRLADLTALPVRSFNTLLVQKIMRTPRSMDSLRLRGAIELVVFLVSTLGIAAMAVYLHIFPAGLGRNVADIAPLVPLVLLVPAFRNLIEYHSELLYATGLTVRRMIILVIVGAAKAAFLAALMASTGDAQVWAPLLNGLYLVLYALSAALAYTALRHRRHRVI